jgi:hypothetical protein
MGRTKLLLLHPPLDVGARIGSPHRVGAMSDDHRDAFWTKPLRSS